MLLYHGTNGQWLENILRKGIEPRRNTNRNNWRHVKHQSNRECVYLTDSYAPHFAMNAARGSKPSCAVIEIETDRLDQTQLWADEDFLEQANRQLASEHPQRAKGELSDRVLFFRRNMMKYTNTTGDPEYPSWWQCSVRYLGTCAYRGVIPPSAMTRAVYWPLWGQLRFIWDPSITLVNQRLCGDMYRELTKRLFEGKFSTREEMMDVRKRAESLRDPENAMLPPIPGWTLVRINK